MRKFLFIGLTALLGVIIFLKWPKGKQFPDQPPIHNQLQQKTTPQPEMTFAERHKQFTTKLTEQRTDDYPTPQPPDGVFDLVKYTSPIGELDAYVSPSPQDGKKYPVIIWLVGGMSNSISEIAWTPGERENDQSATVFREKGILMMYPSRRGGNENPGYHESYFGEVNDIIAAGEYLKGLDYVDPERIYLGGHSTGGTLALLVAECSDQFRAVFSFGPSEAVQYYGREFVTFNMDDDFELIYRAPIYWLKHIKKPTFVFEGTRRGNISSLRKMKKKSKNPLVYFYEVKKSDHFKLIRPISELIADKILQDSDPEKPITIDMSEIEKAMAK